MEGWLHEENPQKLRIWQACKPPTAISAFPPKPFCFLNLSKVLVWFLSSFHESHTGLVPVQRGAQVQPSRGNPGFRWTTHRHVVPWQPWGGVGGSGGWIWKNFVKQWKHQPFIDVSSCFSHSEPLFLVDLAMFEHQTVIKMC